METQTFWIIAGVSIFVISLLTGATKVSLRIGKYKIGNYTPEDESSK